MSKNDKNSVYISTTNAAIILGISVHAVRLGIDRKIFPIGECKASLTGNRTNYDILWWKLNEWTGAPHDSREVKCRRLKIDGENGVAEKFGKSPRTIRRRMRNNEYNPPIGRVDKNDKCYVFEHMLNNYLGIKNE